MAGVTHRDHVPEGIPAANGARDWAGCKGSPTRNAVSPCSPPVPASNAWALSCSKNQQGCGHVKSILGGCVYTANMTVHRGLDQKQHTQCLGGWPKPELPPEKKKKGSEIAVSQRASTEF